MFLFIVHRVMVRMKNLLNNNVWLWDRGKFLNRRFLMQVVNKLQSLTKFPGTIIQNS